MRCVSYGEQHGVCKLVKQLESVPALNWPQTQHRWVTQTQTQAAAQGGA
jgi:hypothetical protein